MGNCRPKKEIIKKEISYWYYPPQSFTPVRASNTPVEFDYKHWHEVGGQNDTLKLISNGSKLEKLYRTRLYSPRGEDSDGNTEYKWEYVYQQKYEIKVMDTKNDPKDKQLDELDDPENEYSIYGYDIEGFYEEGDPIYYNKPIFKRQCKANTVYDEQYFAHIFYWPDNVNISRKVAGIIGTTQTQTGTYGTFGSDGSPVTNNASASQTTYEGVTGTVSGTFTVEGVDSVIENAPDGLIYYHGGSFDNKIFFTYEPDANSDGTLDVIAEGDTVNGWTIDKVINYVTNKSLRRRISKHSKKNQTPSYVFVNDLVDVRGKVSSVSALPAAYSGSIDDYYIVDDNEDTLNQLYYQWNGTAWIGPVNVTGILVGDKVLGKTIPLDTVVTEVKGRKIFLSKPLRARKVRKATFVNSSLNKVNVSTLCYAEISGGSTDFTKGGSYTTGNGCKIRVVAGKGIKTRSAVLGLYAARNKRYLEYSPIFYTENYDCEKIYTEDEDSKYINGDVILEGDEVYLDNVDLVYEPKRDIVYQINNIYWLNFNMPVSKTELKMWLSKYPDDSTFIQMQADIIDTLKASLNSRLVAKVLDSTCNDPIMPNYNKIYYPYEEIDTLTNAIEPLNELNFDECIVLQGPSDALSSNQLEEYLNAKLNSLITSSSFVLPEEMYKRVMTNPDSMYNQYINATNIIQESVSKIQTMPNVPPAIEGENEAPIDLIIQTIRRMPPKFGNLEFLVNDVIFDSDNSLNPNSVENNPTLIIKSIPAFVGNLTSNNPQFNLVKTTKTVRTITNAVDTYELGSGAPEPIPSGNVLDTVTIDGITYQLTLSGLATNTATWMEPGPPGITGNDIGIDEVDNKQFYKHKYQTGARPYPRVIWNDGVNYQSKYFKIANFRMNEISAVVSEALVNKGNPYQDDPVYAEILENISPSATSIKIKGDTSRFFSSGYLLIPKYIMKQESSDLNNPSKHYFYLGEEIIYYGSKTANSFENCIRGQYGTNSSFEVTVPTGEILTNYLYTIQTLGDTNWTELGAPSGYGVGTTFRAIKDGVSGTGTAYIFGSTLKPFDSAPATNTVFTSYEKRNYIVQYWPYKLRTDTSTI